MIRAGAALSCDPDAARAAADAASRALAEAGSLAADAALLFAAGPVDLAAATAAARGILGTRALVGVLGHAVAAGEVEAGNGPAIAVLAISGVDAAPFAIGRDDGPDAIGLEVEGRLARSLGESDLVVVFADPLGPDPARLVEALAALAPATVVGAGAALEAPGRQLLACGDRRAALGACGLVLPLARPARVGVSQGCRPITDPLVVTRVSGHWVLELDGKPALDVFRDVAREPLADDLRRAAESLLVALPRGTSWIARRIAGFAPERRALAVSASPRVGSRLRFALRDADLAREDLAHTLAGLGPAALGLHLCASDRGRALFRHEGLESALVACALAPAAVAALFGSFEIARIGGALEQLAHASVIVAVDPSNS
ncbi:MAG: FIST C-terminal domain-containing protein [Myxococcota bacterium]|jgi:small ligand-binding sensory domain FIST|nr:FIST C-terminal domain-containing protein [Myxococcota bacterium]